MNIEMNPVFALGSLLNGILISDREYTKEERIETPKLQTRMYQRLIEKNYCTKEEFKKYSKELKTLTEGEGFNLLDHVGAAVEFISDYATSEQKMIILEEMEKMVAVDGTVEGENEYLALIRSNLRSTEDRIKTLREIKKKNLKSAKGNLIQVFINLSGLIAIGIFFYFYLD